jgi:hypothetical protein
MFSFILHEKWVPVTTAWRVLRLRMEKRPPRGVPPARVLGEVIITPRRTKLTLLRNRIMCLDPGLIIWNDLSIPEVKRPLGTSTPTWEDNIKMDLQEVG